MELYFAPMEGITGPQFRQAHHRYFSGVDKYYLPFISPTKDHILTPRELRQVSPEQNRGLTAVPQLLTKNADDFLWAARELGEMGYQEVNLNLGCPSGTVVAKGKGAGMLVDLEGLDRFLEKIFSSDLGAMRLSVKTRLGMEQPKEFPELLEIFNRYPIALLIVHPRVRQDYYREPVRGQAFLEELPHIHCPVCYNGGIVTAEGCRKAEQGLPGVQGLMLGQGMLANPALAGQARGGPGPDRETLRAFHDELYSGYLRDFDSGRNTVFHMKELWRYLSRIFEGGEKLFKRIKKAQDSPAYESAVEQIFATLPVRENADWSESGKL